MVKPSRAALLAGALASAVAAQETVGCFYWPFASPTVANPYAHGIYRYRDPRVANDTGLRAKSAVECQGYCANQSNCTVFTWFANSGGCWLQTETATLNVSSNAEYYGADTVAGPKECPLVTDRCAHTAVARPGFPDTEVLAWPENYQPRKGVCWKAVRGSAASGFEPLFDACADTVVELQQVTNCSGLKPVVPPFNKTCWAACAQDPLCAVYEEKNGACYTGLGLDCAVVPPTEDHTGERLGRGTVRTMYSWSQRQFVPGAVYEIGFQATDKFVTAFGNTTFSDFAAARNACSQICIASLSCEFWQYSTLSGCSVDVTSPHYQLAYPLTKDFFKPAEAGETVVGEYIQHTCGVGERPFVPTKTTTPAPAHAEFALEAVDMNCSAIPPEDLVKLKSAYQQVFADEAGVAKSSVDVTIDCQTQRAALKARRLGAADVVSSISTFVHASILVPAGKTAEGIVSALSGSTSLFSSMAESTKAVLGLNSPALGPNFGFHASDWRPTPPPVVSSSGFPSWLWWVLAALALCLVGGIAAYCLGACDEEKKKKKKSSKGKSASREAKESERVPLVAAPEAPAVVQTSAEPVPAAVPAPVPVYSSGAVPMYASGAPIVYTTAPQVVYR